MSAGILVSRNRFVMSATSLGSVDKNIVERRRSGNAARDVLRDKGKLDSSQPIDAQNFSRELLTRHAKIQWKHKLAILISLLIGAWFSFHSMGSDFARGWFFVGTGALLINLYCSNKYLRQDPAETNDVAWNRVFCCLQFVMGLTWAAILGYSQAESSDGLINTLTFAGVMVLMAIALLTSSNLQFGVLLTTLPFVFVMAIRLALNGEFMELGMAGILVGACLFFEHMGSNIRQSFLAHLQSRVVRDQLIVELEEATSISDEARRRAEEANLAKSRFLATMSHELRTPLNAILGFSEVMSNEVMGPLNNEHYKEYVRDIHRSGSHLLKLINEILDLSRVEAGRYEMNEEPLCLTHAAEESRQMVKLKANQKRIQIIMQLQPDLPEINADSRAIRQIILNLLSNALKFTPEGGTIHVKVGWTAGGGQYISIKDSGPGIPEDEIPVVLSSFGQGSIAIKSAEQGTGLGLPIVQALVHMHDGHFELKSKLREGTEVIATFPRSRVRDNMVPGQSGPLYKPSGTQQFNENRQNVSAPPLVGIATVNEHAG